MATLTGDSRRVDLGGGYSVIAPGLRGRVERHIEATADARSIVHSAAAEVGQGVTGVILQVARTELGTQNVVLLPGSTDGVDSAGSASASRLTWMAIPLRSSQRCTSASDALASCS